MKCICGNEAMSPTSSGTYNCYVNNKTKTHGCSIRIKHSNGRYMIAKTKDYHPDPGDYTEIESGVIIQNNNGNAHIKILEDKVCIYEHNCILPKIKNIRSIWKVLDDPNLKEFNQKLNTINLLK